MRRAYALVRRAPLVRLTWRWLFGGSLAAAYDAAAYKRAGGRFSPGAAPDVRPRGDRESGAKIEAEWRFLARLADAAEGEAGLSPLPGRMVLVNCSAAAGGAERQIVHTLAGLRARGVDAVFVGEFIEAGDPALDFHLPCLRAAGVPTFRADPGPDPGPFLYADVGEAVAEQLANWEPDLIHRLLGMVRQLRRLRPEVVHLWQDQTSVLHGLAAVIARIPRIVLSGRNLDPTHFTYHQPWLLPGYKVLAARPEVRLTNNSTAGARAYERWLGLPSGTIDVIANAVVPPPSATVADRHAERDRRRVPHDALLVAGVFRMSPEKRPLLWMEAAAYLARERADVRFIVAGDGPMTAAVRSHAAALGLGDRIDFLGEIREVDALLGAADVLLLASAQEGTPNVLLEAQACDTPVATTDAGGAAACVVDGETGVVIEASHVHPQGIAAATVRAAALGGRMRALGLGRAHAIARFGLDQMLDATLEAYGPFSSMGAGVQPDHRSDALTSRTAAC